MSLTADPHEAAHRVRTVNQAARLKASLESELALNDNLPPGWEDKAELGLHVLNANFPDAEDHPAYEEAPGLSRGAQKGLTPVEKKEDAPAKTATPARRAARRGGGASVPDRAARRVARSGSRFGRRLLAPTIGATTTAGQLAMKVMGWGLGLSLLYLLLTKGTAGGPRGSAVEQLFGGASGAVKGLVSASADPLSPKTWQAAPAAAPAAAAAPRPAAKPRPTVHPRSSRQPVGAPR